MDSPSRAAGIGGLEGFRCAPDVQAELPTIGGTGPASPQQGRMRHPISGHGLVLPQKLSPIFPDALLTVGSGGIPFHVKRVKEYSELLQARVVSSPPDTIPSVAAEECGDPDLAQCSAAGRRVTDGAVAPRWACDPSVKQSQRHWGMRTILTVLSESLILGSQFGDFWTSTMIATVVGGPELHILTLPRWRRAHSCRISERKSLSNKNLR